MIVALYMLLAIVVVGTVLRLTHKPTQPVETSEASTSEAEEEECCGMHITCERDSLLAAVSHEIEYFDDEELDTYAGIAPDSHSPEAVEAFRDVLLTLRPDDIAPWARSLQLRGINLPTSVREELLLIVAETRAMRTAPQS